MAILGLNYIKEYDLKDIYSEGTWNFSAYPNFHCDLTEKKCRETVQLMDHQLVTYDNSLADKMHYKVDFTDAQIRKSPVSIFFRDKPDSLVGEIMISRESTQIIYWSYSWFFSVNKLITFNEKKYDQVDQIFYYNQESGNYFPAIIETRLRTMDKDGKETVKTYRSITMGLLNKILEISDDVNVNPDGVLKTSLEQYQTKEP